ncbi:hypothetical protein [Egicoccus sp. AB-alg2]|uniref:hypothetical protein n=1 Tax=Egicoccus sp. AB-alg2 TaxID=3242693 RepID=UPI00359EAAB5
MHATAVHQPDLRRLAALRDGSGAAFTVRVELRPVLASRPTEPRRVLVLGPDATELGELPRPLADEVHTGLQLLASLEPPYVLSCEAVAWHEPGPEQPLRVTLHLDLAEVGRLTG